MEWLIMLAVLEEAFGVAMWAEVVAWLQAMIARCEQTQCGVRD